MSTRSTKIRKDTEITVVGTTTAMPIYNIKKVCIPNSNRFRIVCGPIVGEKERSLMLFVCQVTHAQLVTPEGKKGWIENQGREDYQVAVEGYRRWIRSLEREP